MLKIAVDFLSGRCFAARWENPTKADWPVDSARIFSAMVAAIRRLDAGDQTRARAWLEWLEALPAPVIMAVDIPKEASPSFGYAVRPVIAKNQKLGVNVVNPHTDRVYLTSTSLLDPVVLFEFAVNLPESDRVIVERLLANVTYVGSSESIVRMYLSDEAQHDKHVRYVPSGHREFVEHRGLLTLRAPYAGRLAHLDMAYADLQRRDRSSYEPRKLTQAHPTLYAIVRSGNHEASRTSIDSDMGDVVALEFIGRRDSECADHSYGNLRNRPDLDTLRFAVATDAVRRAFLSNLGDNAPEELTGHALGEPTTRGHVAFIPLAEVGFLRATSRLRGVALVLPRAFSAELRERALRAFRFAYITIDGVAWRVQPVLDSELTSLRSSRYCCLSETWVTATPIVLPRYPKAREGVVDIIARALANAGLPLPESIETSTVPFVEGAYPISLYHNVVPGNRYIVHARITFAMKVRGPVLIGRHRHQGYGFCLPAQRVKAPDAEVAS